MYIRSFLHILTVIATGPRTFTFENDPVGPPPSEFEFARTGNGPEGKWTVEPERGKRKESRPAAVERRQNRLPIPRRHPEKRIPMEARGNHFVVWFDGQKVLDAHDDIFQAGRVGMWTKADSVIEFDDFMVAP